MNVMEIFPPASTEALKRTGLDVQVAGAISNEVNFFAAHGDTASYAVLVDKRFPKDELVSVWELSGGTKTERKLRAQNVRDRYAEK